MDGRNHDPFPTWFGHMLPVPRALDLRSHLVTVFSVRVVGVPIWALSLLWPHDGIWKVLFLKIRKV